MAECLFQVRDVPPRTFHVPTYMSPKIISGDPYAGCSPPPAGILRGGLRGAAATRLPAAVSVSVALQATRAGAGPPYFLIFLSGRRDAKEFGFQQPNSCEYYY